MMQDVVPRTPAPRQDQNITQTPVDNDELEVNLEDIQDIESETAADEPIAETPQPIDSQTAHESKPHFPARLINRCKQWWGTLSKRKRIVVVLVAVLLVALLVAGGFLLLHRHKSAPVVTHKISVAPPPPPKPIISDLTGLVVSDASVNNRPVTGVMIENSLDARPQSGLDKAGIVFEAVAEGGITRFLALYQDTQPSYMGPVRSARPYYVQWDLGFGAALAHVGGSPEALSDIKTWGVHDLDQFANGGSYERVASRAAPHNVYTSASQLNSLETSKGITGSKYTSFLRKADSPSKTPNASSINISPSSSDYNSHYDYDSTANGYKRSEGGSPHMQVDASGNQTQITPKVVIAMVMQQGIESDDYHTSYNVIGNGQAYVFQDGTVTTGTWQKSDNTSQITLTDSSGKPIALNAGQTWFVAVNSSSEVAYK